ncbi:MAG: T9SS type A sorting domain-containing protein [Owenweeksia sp.]
MIRIRQRSLETEVFPNPVVEGENLGIMVEGSSGTVQLNVVDISGKRIYEREVTNFKDGGRLVIPVENWKPGVYLLRISDDYTSETFKFIVE